MALSKELQERLTEEIGIIVEDEIKSLLVGRYKATVLLRCLDGPNRDLLVTEEDDEDIVVQTIQDLQSSGLKS